MKFLFDLFPVILFFTAFKFAEKQPDAAAAWLNQFSAGTIDASQAPILIATVVVIVATLAQVAWVLLRHGKVDKMLWFSLGIVVLFGGLTLYFNNPDFIKWKPTILYWGMGGGMAISALAFKKNAIKAMLGAQIEMPGFAWQRLNVAWIAFFAFMGGLNLFVAFSFPIDVWVNFKLFGGMGLMLAFVVAQGVFLAKYIEEKE
ncbi:MAG: septation protein A [Betaproteobacteria bacterium]